MYVGRANPDKGPKEAITIARRAGLPLHMILKRGEPHCRLDAADLRRLEPGLVGPLIGGITFDECQVPGGGLRRIFVNGPNGVVIELDHDAAKEAVKEAVKEQG